MNGLMYLWHNVVFISLKNNEDILFSQDLKKHIGKNT